MLPARAGAAPAGRRGSIDHAAISPLVPRAGVHHGRRGGRALLLPGGGGGRSSSVLGSLVAVVYLRRQVPPLAARGGRRRSQGASLLEIVWTRDPARHRHGHLRLGRERLSSASHRPPADAMEIYVVGKQWMWKFQHPEGQREINELHVPVGRAGQADHDLRGRDPQLLRARLPRQDGRAAGPLHHRLVPGHQAGHATICSAPSTAARSTRA